MLGKLLKYDFKTLLHTLLPVYGISFILSIISNIFIRINDITPIFKVPMSFIVMLSVLVSIGTVFITFIIGIINFYKQMVKDEGYLLHTLPVSKDSIIISKLISLLVMEIVSFVVVVFTFLITLKVDLSVVTDAIKYFMEIIGDYKLTTLIGLFALLIGQIANILLIYVSISFGQRHSTNKLLYSIVYGVVIYNITQVITTVIYLPILLNDKYVEALNATIPESQILNVMLVIASVTSLIIGVTYYIFTKRNLETKLNLE